MNLKKLRNKVIAAFVVMMFALATTVGVTYAWWDMLQAERTETDVIDLGTGGTISIDATVNSGTGKTLVPSGVTMGPNDVTSITLTYTIGLDKQYTNPLALSATATNILIDGSATYASLVSIAISGDTTINGDADATVELTITLGMPADQTAYNAVAGKAITFTVTFTGTQA